MVRIAFSADRGSSFAAPIEAGKTIELGTLWNDRTAVIVFIRHFG